MKVIWCDDDMLKMEKEIEEHILLMVPNDFMLLIFDKDNVRLVELRKNDCGEFNKNVNISPYRHGFEMGFPAVIAYDWDYNEGLQEYLCPRS